MAEGPNKTYYEILGVSNDATEEQIEATYKALVKQFAQCADSGDGETAMIQTNLDKSDLELLYQAYQVLTNGQQRAEYDRELEELSVDPLAIPDNVRTMKISNVDAMREALLKKLNSAQAQENSEGEEVSDGNPGPTVDEEFEEESPSEDHLFDEDSELQTDTEEEPQPEPLVPHDQTMRVKGLDDVRKKLKAQLDIKKPAAATVKPVSNEPEVLEPLIAADSWNQEDAIQEPQASVSESLFDLPSVSTEKDCETFSGIVESLSPQDEKEPEPVYHNLLDVPNKTSADYFLIFCGYVLPIFTLSAGVILQLAGSS